jgi:hypothetical protein
MRNGSLNHTICFIAFLGVWRNLRECIGVVGWLAAGHWNGCAQRWTRLIGPQSQEVSVETDLYLYAVGVLSNGVAGRVGQGCKLVGVVTSNCVHHW